MSKQMKASMSEIEIELEAIKQLEAMTKEQYIDQIIANGYTYEPKSVRIERLMALIRHANEQMIKNEKQE